jgi:hypothetical protein
MPVMWCCLRSCDTEGEGGMRSKKYASLGDELQRIPTEEG